MTTVRWVAQSVLGRAHAALLQEVPTPQLVSAGLAAASPPLERYLLNWARHPQVGGTFAAKTRWLRWLPDAWLLRLLTARGYDGIVYFREQSVIGHVFYQRHGDELHGFSTGVAPELDGRGYSVVMMLDYLAHASGLPGVVRARVGRGRNNATRRLLERVAEHHEELGWSVSADGWVTFSTPARPGGSLPAPAGAPSPSPGPG